MTLLAFGTFFNLDELSLKTGKSISWTENN